MPGILLAFCIGVRPFGLYAITALLVINALLIALDDSRAYVSVVVSMGIPRPAFDRLRDADADRLLRYAAAAIHIATAIGIWTYRRWAWTGLMIVVGFALAEGLLRYTRGQPEYADMVFNVLIVFYLNQREVQQLFRRGDGALRPA